MEAPTSTVDPHQQNVIPGSTRRAGNLGGGFTFPTDLNDSGRIVGSSTLNKPNGTYHAFCWSASSGIVDLDTRNPILPSGASAINNAGQIVGSESTSQTLGRPHVAIWTVSP
jgi:probable HAF family extracellular repeat protein